MDATSLDIVGNRYKLDALAIQAVRLGSGDSSPLQYGLFGSHSLVASESGTTMINNRDEVLAAALQLSEDDRWLIASQLWDTLPDAFAGLSDNDPRFMEELDRRADNPGKTIPAADLWKHG